MIYAIGAIGSPVRMFMESESRARVAAQLGPDEVAFEVAAKTRGVIRCVGEDEYEVEPDPTED